MTFEMFNRFLQKICDYSRQELPNFTNTRDLFQCIDIKNDGVIDMFEWQTTFKQIDKDITEDAKKYVFKVKWEPMIPSVEYMINWNSQYSKTLNKSPKRRYAKSVSPTKKRLNFAAWEQERDYTDVIKIIGRCRKFILTQFQKLIAKGITIQPKHAKKVISKILRIQGKKVDKAFWPQLLRFATADHVFDWNFLLSIYKIQALKMTAK